MPKQLRGCKKGMNSSDLLRGALEGTHGLILAVRQGMYSFCDGVMVVTAGTIHRCRSKLAMNACRGQRRAKLEAKQRLARGTISPQTDNQTDPKQKARAPQKRGGRKGAKGPSRRAAIKKEESEGAFKYPNPMQLASESVLAAEL